MHRATPRFWSAFEELPESVQRVARRSFRLLVEDPYDPSLRFKRVGSFWSARVGRGHRALAVKDEDDFVWVWGAHDDYERLLDR